MAQLIYSHVGMKKINKYIVVMYCVGESSVRNNKFVRSYRNYVFNKYSQVNIWNTKNIRAMSVCVIITS